MLTKLGLIAQNYSVSLAFWEDGLIDETTKEPFDRNEIFPSDVEVIGFAWRAIWDKGEGHSVHALANSGYKVCLFTHMIVLRSSIVCLTTIVYLSCIYVCR